MSSPIAIYHLYLIWKKRHKPCTPHCQPCKYFFQLYWPNTTRFGLWHWHKLRKYWIARRKNQLPKASDFFLSNNSPNCLCRTVRIHLPLRSFAHRRNTRRAGRRCRPIAATIKNWRYKPWPRIWPPALWESNMGQLNDRMDYLLRGWKKRQRLFAN